MRLDAKCHLAGQCAAQEIGVTTPSEEAWTHYTTGARLLDVGRPQEAIVHFRKAVELDSTFAAAYLGIANAAASTQEFKANLDAAARHIEGKSEGEKLLLELTRTFLTNNAEQTLELAQKLTQTHPNSPRAWLALGNAQQALNQHAAARESFQRALALEGAGQAEEAKRIFAEVGASNFNSVGFALVRADALKRAGAGKTG